MDLALKFFARVVNINDDCGHLRQMCRLSRWCCCFSLLTSYLQLSYMQRLLTVKILKYGDRDLWICLGEDGGPNLPAGTCNSPVPCLSFCWSAAAIPWLTVCMVAGSAIIARGGRGNVAREDKEVTLTEQGCELEQGAKSSNTGATDTWISKCPV